MIYIYEMVVFCHFQKAELNIVKTVENPTPSRRLGADVRRRLRRDACALLVQCLVNDCRLKAEMRIVRLHKHFSQGLLVSPDPEIQNVGAHIVD